MPTVLNSWDEGKPGALAEMAKVRAEASGSVVEAAVEEEPAVEEVAEEATEEAVEEAEATEEAEADETPSQDDENATTDAVEGEAEEGD